jgi:hypothetical protein
MDGGRLTLPGPRFEKLYHLEADIGRRYEVGDTPDGVMSIVGITGGRVEGERVKGTIHPVSASWNTYRKDRVDHIDARYIIQTDDGSTISLFTDGYAVSGDVFRERLFFTAGKRRYRWLNGVVALAVSGVGADGRLVSDAYVLR